MTNQTNYHRSGCKRATWEKASFIPNKNSQIWRRDPSGAIIQYSKYGNPRSKYGWDIDHIIPQAQGGSDHIDNLQPLNCHVNRSCGAKCIKPGLNPRKLHEYRKQRQLERNPNIFTSKSCATIRPSKWMWVRSTPLSNPSLGKILHVTKTEVQVQWSNTNFVSFVIHDKILFQDLPVTRTRRCSF